MKVGSCVKSPQILHVFVPQFFMGQPPEFLDLRYKAHPVRDHVAKLQGDRPREPGDPVAKVINKK